MRLLSVLLLLLTAIPAAAVTPADAARAALLARWPDAQITGGGETLPPCPGTLQAEAPSALRDGQAQVRLRCQAQPGWTRYLRLAVQRPGQVLVLRRALAPGEALSPADWMLEPRDLARLAAGVISDPQQAQGQLARRRLAAGSVLDIGMLAPTLAIRRGQTVTLVGRAAGLEVLATGIALADAASGSRVAVRNTVSRRQLEGIARADGRVEMAP